MNAAVPATERSRWRNNARTEVTNDATNRPTSVARANGPIAGRIDPKRDNSMPTGNSAKMNSTRPTARPTAHLPTRVCGQNGRRGDAEVGGPPRGCPTITEDNWR